MKHFHFEFRVSHSNSIDPHLSTHKCYQSTRLANLSPRIRTRLSSASQFFPSSSSSKQSNNIIQTTVDTVPRSSFPIYNEFSRKHGREGAGIKSCHVVSGDYSPAAQHRVNCSLITLYRVSPRRVHHTRVPRSLRYSAIIFDKRRPVGSVVLERRNTRSDLAVDLIDPPGYLKFFDFAREDKRDRVEARGNEFI